MAVSENNRCCKTLLFTCLTLSLYGCGNEVDSENAHESQNKPVLKLEELSISEKFDWSTHTELLSNIQLVSNFSYVNDMYVPLKGSYIITVHEVDSNNDTVINPIFKGMSNASGNLDITISFSNHLQMIELRAARHNTSCLVRVEPKYLGPDYQMGCDVFLDLDI